jgi:ABC-type branched-subunit amino acid transport system permease subunit
LVGAYLLGTSSEHAFASRTTVDVGQECCWSPLQQTLADQGSWYLILVGAIAVVMAVWVPCGIWGLIGDRLGLRLFPVGYWLDPRPPR